MYKRIIKPKIWNSTFFRGVFLFSMLSILSAFKAELQAQSSQPGQIIITTGDNACVGQAISLDAEIVGVEESSITFSKFRWTITSGSGSLSSTSGRTVTVTWNDASGGTVNVTYTGGSVTTETGTQTVYPGSQNVTPLPPPSISLSAPTVVGEGSTVTLNASGANNYYGWQYKPASLSYYINMTGNTASITSHVLTESTTFKVAGYNQNLCSSVKTIVVNVVKRPVLNNLEGIVFSDLSTAYYTMGATPGANATGCNWYKSDGTLVKTNSTSASLPLSAYGANHFYVKSVNGGVESSKVDFTVYKLKATPVISHQGPNFTCDGDQVRVSVNVQGVETGISLTYSWTGFKIGNTQELDLGLVSTNQTMYLQVNATAPLGATANSDQLTKNITPGTPPSPPSVTTTNCGKTLQFSGALVGETYWVTVEQREMNTWLPPVNIEDTDGDGIIQLNDYGLIKNANIEVFYKAYIKRGSCKSSDVFIRPTDFNAEEGFTVEAEVPTGAACGTNVTYTLKQGGQDIGVNEYGSYKWKVRTEYTGLSIVSIPPLEEEFVTTVAELTRPLRWGATSVFVTITDKNGCERTQEVVYNGTTISSLVANPLTLNEVTFNNCGKLSIDNPTANTTYFLLLETAVRTYHSDGTVTTNWIYDDQNFQSNTGLFTELPILDADHRLVLSMLNASHCATEAIYLNVPDKPTLSQASAGCINQNVSFQLTNSIKGATGLTWKRKKSSDGSIISSVGNLNDLTYSFLLDETYEVWAEITDDLGCVHISNKLNAIATSPPAAPVVMLAQTDCQNGNFLLRVQGGGEGDTYKWYKGSMADANPISTTNPCLLIEGLEAITTYHVTITNSNGCEGNDATITLEGDSKLNKPTLVLAPEAMLNPYEEDGTTLKDITLQVSGAGVGQTYVWTNGSTVVEDASGTYKAKYSQTTYVTVAIKNTREGGCTGEAITIPVRIRHDYNGVDATHLNMVSTQIVRIPDVKTEEGLNSLSVTGEQTLRSNTYLDGLGRFVQSVSQQVTPDKKDAVKTVLYDDIGRRSIEYLGYNAGNNSGTYKMNAITAVEGFYKSGTNYANSNFPYAQVNYEPSPLNRSFKSFAPGKSWVGQAKGGEVGIRTNVANEVRKWQVNNDLNAGEVTTGQEDLTLNALEGNRTLYQAEKSITLTEGFSVPTTSSTITLELKDGDGNKPGLDGYYAAGELLVTTITDEDGKVTETYTNKYGQVILKRAKVDANTWAETYNIYNKFNQLSYVLSPEAVKALKDNNWQWAHNGHDVTDDVRRLSYRYYYDARGRAIIKEVPNAGKTMVVYDELDRPILTQNARQRLEGKWDFVKYDSLSRPVVSGIYTNAETRVNLQAAIDQGFCTTYKRFENFDANETTNHYYTNGTFPKDNLEVLSVNYYDDYRWQAIQAGFDMSTEFSTITGTTYFKHVLGAPTGGKVKRLDGSNKFMFSAIYYDERGRVKQTLSENHKEGVDLVVQEYKFDGQVTQTVMKHQRKISTTHYENHYVNQWMKYDHIGRVTEAYHKITDAYVYRTLDNALAEADFNPEPISKAEYNKLGQVIKSKVGKTHDNKALQTIDYKFNIRGWLTHLNDAGLSNQANDNDLFGFELKYDAGGAHQYFNGNIAQMVWKSALDGVQRKYDYEYDGMDRLTKADYSDDAPKSTTNPKADANFDVDNIVYDLNGNIKQLRRFGLTQFGGEFDVIDDLSYTYKGNQLLGVDDATDGTTVNGDAKDFRDNHKYATNGQEYHYDENGNLTSDKNKNITSIRYNRFDMPQTIVFGTGEMIEFFYDGAGSKLRKLVTDKDGNCKTTDYVAGFVYEQDNLQFVSTGVGRALYTPNTLAGQSLGTNNLWAYEYYYTDHQGNMRMSFRRGDAATTHARMEDATQDKTVNGFEYDSSVVDNSPTGNGKAAKVGADTKPLGIWKTIAVSKGDQVEMKVQSYISGAPTHTTGPALEPFITNLAGSYNPKGEGNANNPNSLLVGIRYTPGTEPNQGNNLPAAYLRYVFYNDQGEAVKSDRIYVSDLANGTWQQLMLNFTAETNGTLQLYTANESDDKVVYFDDMEVTFTPQIIAQETHYYPFGMQMVGVGKQGMIPNRYLYNGQTEREESFGLQWDETPFRRYDPQLGRFHGVDALASKYVGITPYQYAFNNPVMLNDPSGLAPASGRKRVVDENAERNGGRLVHFAQSFIGQLMDRANDIVRWNSTSSSTASTGNKNGEEGAAERGGRSQSDDANDLTPKNEKSEAEYGEGDENDSNSTQQTTTTLNIRTTINYLGNHKIRTIHDYGNTRLLKIDYDPRNNRVNAVILINMHTLFKKNAFSTTPDGKLEQENPGLHRSVLLHERGHDRDFRDVLQNQVFTINIGGKAKTGSIATLTKTYHQLINSAVRSKQMTSSKAVELKNKFSSFMNMTAIYRMTRLWGGKNGVENRVNMRLLKRYGRLPYLLDGRPTHFKGKIIPND
ncbi:hypothetical protein BKI52_35370 [marine bacterium AO1-C]|nr:hypothetical protein BKI52_35370 [marine bacterium AO1-C]